MSGLYQSQSNAILSYAVSRSMFQSIAQRPYLYFQIAYCIQEPHNIRYPLTIGSKVNLLKDLEDVNHNKCSLQKWRNSCRLYSSMIYQAIMQHMNFTGKRIENPKSRNPKICINLKYQSNNTVLIRMHIQTEKRQSCISCNIT